MYSLLAASLFLAVASALPHEKNGDIASLFRRQTTTYPPMGSIPDRSLTPQAWLDKLASANIPNVPVATGTPLPQYPGGLSATDPSVCSFTYECDGPDDLKVPPTGVVAFTFDDGPQAGSEALWEYLGQQNARGQVTHFMIGGFIARNPDMFRKMGAEGGHLAVHTWSHNYMTTLSNEDVVAELGWTMQIMADMNGGRIPGFWRPPYGDVDNRVRAIAKNVFGLETVTWNQDTGDWNLDQAGSSTTGTTIAETYRTWLADRSRGLNVLHHEVRESQVEAFKGVFPALTNGWEVKNIADAFGKPWYLNAATANGTVESMAVGGTAASTSGGSTPSSTSAVSSASSNAASSAASGVSRSAASGSASSSTSARASATTQAAAATSTGAAVRETVPILGLFGALFMLFL